MLNLSGISAAIQLANQKEANTFNRDKEDKEAAKATETDSKDILKSDIDSRASRLSMEEVISYIENADTDAKARLLIQHLTPEQLSLLRKADIETDIALAVDAAEEEIELETEDEPLEEGTTELEDELDESEDEPLEEGTAEFDESEDEPIMDEDVDDEFEAGEEESEDELEDDEDMESESEDVESEPEDVESESEDESVEVDGANFGTVDEDTDAKVQNSAFSDNDERLNFEPTEPEDEDFESEDEEYESEDEDFESEDEDFESEDEEYESEDEEYESKDEDFESEDEEYESEDEDFESKDDSDEVSEELETTESEPTTVTDSQSSVVRTAVSDNSVKDQSDKADKKVKTGCIPASEQDISHTQPENSTSCGELYEDGWSLVTYLTKNVANKEARHIDVVRKYYSDKQIEAGERKGLFWIRKNYLRK